MGVTVEFVLAQSCKTERGPHTGLHNSLDLGNNSNVDNAGNIKGANAIDYAQVKAGQVQPSKVELVEYASLGNSQNSLQLLELEESIQVECVIVEDVCKGKNIKVVLTTQNLKEVEIQAVHLEKIPQILLLEVQIIQLPSIKRGALEDRQSNRRSGFGLSLRSRRRRSGGDGSESTSDDGRQLHCDGLAKKRSKLSVIGIYVNSKGRNGAQLRTVRLVICRYTHIHEPILEDRSAYL